MNKDLLYQVVTSQISNKRQPLAHSKDRSEVRGGGKKPWRQKGTGRARHGSIRSPIWVGGGVTHGPLKQKDYSKNLKSKKSVLFIGESKNSALTKAVKNIPYIFSVRPEDLNAKEILEKKYLI